MTSRVDFEDRSLSLGLARVSEAAALASARLVGRGGEKAADQAEVKAMRDQLNFLDIKGVAVIGEGLPDEAPGLLGGEEVGTGTGPAVEIDKPAIGPGCPKDVVSLDMSPGERVKALAASRGCDPAALTVHVLERPDNEAITTDLDRAYSRDGMVTAGMIFAATGIADGSIVAGLKRMTDWFEAEMILMRSRNGSERRIVCRSPVQ